MDEILQSIYDVLTSFRDSVIDAGSFVLDNVLSLISSVFSFFGSWAFDFVFVGLKKSTVSFGTKIFNFLFSNFSSTIFSLDFLFYLLGLIFIIFLFKRVISIVRG